MTVTEHRSSRSAFLLCAVILLNISLNNTIEAARLIKSLKARAATAPVTSIKSDAVPTILSDSTSDVSVATSPVKEKNILPSSYIMTSCEAGEEKALKTEISKNHPSLRLAFSRPGYVTFTGDVATETSEVLSLNIVGTASTLIVVTGDVDRKSVV